MYTYVVFGGDVFNLEVLLLKSIFTMTLCAQFDLDKYILVQHNNTLNLNTKNNFKKEV